MTASFTPIRIDTKDPAVGPSAGRRPLFYIDGVEHSIPVDVPGNLALQAIEWMAELGDAMATRKLMIEVLGEESYRALVNCTSISKGEMQAIQQVIKDLVFGEQEQEGKG